MLNIDSASEFSLSFLLPFTWSLFLFLIKCSFYLYQMIWWCALAPGNSCCYFWPTSHKIHCKRHTNDKKIWSNSYLPITYLLLIAEYTFYCIFVWRSVNESKCNESVSWREGKKLTNTKLKYQPKKGKKTKKSIKRATWPNSTKLIAAYFIKVSPILLCFIMSSFVVDNLVGSMPLFGFFQM